MNRVAWAMHLGLCAVFAEHLQDHDWTPRQIAPCLRGWWNDCAPPGQTWTTEAVEQFLSDTAVFTSRRPTAEPDYEAIGDLGDYLVALRRVRRLAC